MKSIPHSQLLCMRLHMRLSQHDRWCWRENCWFISAEDFSRHFSDFSLSSRWNSNSHRWLMTFVSSFGRTCSIVELMNSFSFTKKWWDVREINSWIILIIQHFLINIKLNGWSQLCTIRRLHGHKSHATVRLTILRNTKRNNLPFSTPNNIFFSWFSSSRPRSPHLYLAQYELWWKFFTINWMLMKTANGKKVRGRRRTTAIILLIFLINAFCNFQ